METIKALHDALLGLAGAAAVLFWATSPKPSHGWGRWAYAATTLLIGGALLTRLVQGGLWLAARFAP